MKMLRARHIFNKIHARHLHLLKEKSFISGDWVPAPGGNGVLQVLNPANCEVVGVVPDLPLEEAATAIVNARNAFETWRKTTAKERGKLLRKLFELLEENKEDVARIMTLESGKPLAESLGEVAYGNSFIEWYAEEARRIDGEIIPSPVASKKILVQKEPIGVAALITPWNFPLAMVTRKAGAALAAGCTCIVKPAEDTPFTALAVAALAEQAGFPEGVFTVLTTGRQNAPAFGKLFCEHPLVAGISFTGSTHVGKILYRHCASGVKRLGLELGGNAPFIVFPTADLDDAVRGAIVSKFRNCGQTCVASNRFLVHEHVYHAFVEKMSAQVKALRMGAGVEEGVAIGPLINREQMAKVSEMVEEAVQKGAKVVVGGKAAVHLGELFYEPTILVDVNETMSVYHEEVFGPIVAISAFATEEECLHVANGTSRGLAAYFYTQNVAQIFRVSSALEAGMVGVNEGLISTAEAPFGGVKESGLGREGSHHGIDDYTSIKYVCLGGLH